MFFSTSLHATNYIDSKNDPCGEPRGLSILEPQLNPYLMYLCCAAKHMTPLVMSELRAIE